jgi:cytochrome P450
MMLPFNVINKAAFGMDLPWTNGGGRADVVGAGHTLSYRAALHTVIERLFHVILFPGWVLRCLPSGYTRGLYAAHVETRTYLGELMQRRERELELRRNVPGRRRKVDIMSSLVDARASQLAGKSKEQHGKGKAADEGEGEALTDKAILANVFLMLIAGHETTATALLLALIELAINIEWQHEVQQNLDRILGQRAHESWTLSDAAALSSSKLGATLSEVIRLYPPVNIIPKGTRKNSPQSVRESAKEFVVPANTAVQLLVVSAHHNPRYWPAPEQNSDALDRFWPRRWLTRNDDARTEKSEQHVELKEPGSGSGTTSKQLLRTYPGTYIPFSIGARGCIGRRFAEIELSGVLAVIFKEYSLELDVGSLFDKTVTELMDGEELKAVYEEAKDKARQMVRRGMKHHLTMQLKGGQIPLRLVRRGKERFLRAYV